MEGLRIRIAVALSEQYVSVSFKAFMPASQPLCAYPFYSESHDKS